LSRRLVDADVLMRQLTSFPYYPSGFVTDDENTSVAIANAFREYNEYLINALHHAMISDEDYIIVRVEKSDLDK